MTDAMLDLLGDPVPETPRMTDPLPMRVFRMNDCDWWLAHSLSEAKVSYLETCGPMSEFDDPRELTDEELDRLHYMDTDANDRPIKASRRTFRQELCYRIEDGVNVPQLFASTES